VGFRSRGRSRRPPISLYKVVSRTGGYTYDVEVWDLSIVQGPLIAPCQTLAKVTRVATFASLYPTALRQLVAPRGWGSRLSV
jgi:hypothetical protein